MKSEFLKKSEIIPWLIGFGIFMPMFFTLSGGLYRSSTVVTDSGGVLMTLPLPISIITCCVAIVFLYPNVRKPNVAMIASLGMICALSISNLITGHHEIKSDRKLISLVQVMLPFSGLLIGEMIEGSYKSIAKSFLVVLTVVLPFQLLGSMVNSPWDNEGYFLSDQVGFFTIYSHIQYVPLIFVCAFAYAVSNLHDQFRRWLGMLSFLMLLYVLKSSSYLTLSAYILVVVGMLFSHGYFLMKNFKLYAFAIVVLAVMIGSALKSEGEHSGVLWNFAGATYSKVNTLFDGKIPQNLQERINDWKLFGSGIIDSQRTLFVGHAEPMPREIRSSAHNWYIDIAYTFGVIGIFPVLGLLTYTGRLCWLFRECISPQTWWLVGIVFYLVVIDSNFKVTLRQPYPGIFAFFMWGLLLARLSEIKRSTSQ